MKESNEHLCCHTEPRIVGIFNLSKYEERNLNSIKGFD